jgi:DNA replication protein DnaC
MERLAARREEAKQRLEERRASFDGDCMNCWDDPETVCDQCERGRALFTERQAKAARASVAAAGVPRRFLDHTFETFPHKGKAELLAFCENWNGKENLLLYGRYGVGKTGLLAAAIRHVVLTTVPGKIMFSSTVALTDALRAGYNDGTFQETMNRAQSAALLVLDDLGSEKASEWVQERLFSIIDYRYGNMRPTWASSNLSLEDLASQIGERSFWRLIENGRVIELRGPNLRERRPS